MCLLFTYYLCQESRKFYDSLMNKANVGSTTNGSAGNGTAKSQPAVHDFSVTESDHYKVLGVAYDCSQQEIKRAYISLSRKLHPDKNPAPDAKEKFQRLGAAFAILHDEVRV